MNSRKTNYFIHICPECRTFVNEEMNIFETSDQRPHQFTCRLPCCKGVTSEISKTARQQYEVRVICVYCGRTHIRHFSTAELWNSESGAVRCPLSGHSIFFFGTDRKKINASAADTSESIRTVFGAASKGAPRHPADPISVEMTMSIEKLMRRGNLKCSCSGEQAGIILEFTDKELVLKCSSCGNELAVEISKDNLIRLMNAEKIVLK